MNNLIVLLGPTGVGKTELSLRVAERFGSPILSSDSRQLFRELPVGTAAPTPEQMRRVKHYFVGTLSIHFDPDGGHDRRLNDVYRCRMQGDRRYPYGPS